jgi:hypothetical protein
MNSCERLQRLYLFESVLDLLKNECGKNLESFIYRLSGSFLDFLHEMYGVRTPCRPMRLPQFLSPELVNGFRLNLVCG